MSEVTEGKKKVDKFTQRRNASMDLLMSEEGPNAKLTELQGVVNPESLRFTKAASLAVGPYGGQIADVQGSLKSLAENAADAGLGSEGVTGEGTDNSAMIALLQEQANNLAKQLFVSEQSFKVLSQTPYVGSFAQGGIVPGVGPKLATVHGGEMIGPAGSPTIVVLVEDGAVDARRIRAISGQTAERMARRAGKGRIPGRAGSMG
jgi:hypothetical protein